ncbi:hypothetical protein [Hymenobacter metallilatus]|uniref:Uncharacterized protein n=1 Tax=Hymenobacter metallilatus TaxID=2493666 RepID=A0A428JCT7_9BACT|nr:hypothetical protein [Hymenobacter metallilatus]RSK29848.1 hypothetical protein EI290_16055 [Hymenobacter metallilatus]
MTRLEYIATSLARLPAVLAEQVEQTIHENAAFLEDANTAQLAQGKRADGSEILPEYSPLTLAIKQLQGRSTHVTLYDEGDFYSSVKAQLTGDKGFEMIATDSKARALESKYGDDILGLSEEALDEFKTSYIKPDLQQKTRDTLGL